MGLAAVVLHERWLLLALAVAAVAALLTALPPRWWGRPAAAVGLGVVVGRGAVPRPEGDYLVGADPQGYVLLGLVVAAVLGSLLTLGRRR